MQLEPPFRWHGDHIAADVDGARALFTTRRGGVSEGPFASLNLGLKTADERANVEENRARAAAATGHSWDDFLYGWQVHGATVRRATGRRPQPTAQEDGQVTALTGHPALVFVADCTPVLLVASSPRVSRPCPAASRHWSGPVPAAAATRSARRSTPSSRATTPGAASATSTSRPSSAPSSPSRG
jgi:hypothetical protein